MTRLWRVSMLVARSRLSRHKPDQGGPAAIVAFSNSIGKTRREKEIMVDRIRDPIERFPEDEGSIRELVKWDLEGRTPCQVG